jgi:hypothetical protein
MIFFIVGSIVIVAGLVFITWRFLDSRRQDEWREHEDEMMPTITEQRIRRNFMQGG